MTRVIVDRNAGFCAGVRRAIRETEQLLSHPSPERRRIASYGQLVHNREVTDDLTRRGLTDIDRPEEAGPGDEVVVRTHGISPREQQALHCAGAGIRDFTCPRVKRVHRQILEKREQGFRIAIVGDPDHPEVRGQLGYAGEGGMVLSAPEDARRVPAGRKIAVFAQTTLSPAFYREVVAAMERRGLDLSVTDSLCPYVGRRQRWITEVSKVADLSLILGGRNSSNTRRLHQLAAANGPAVHMSSPEELDVEETLRYSVVALTAGASTSDRTIREVVNRLEAAGAVIEYR